MMEVRTKVEGIVLARPIREVFIEKDRPVWALKSDRI